MPVSAAENIEPLLAYLKEYQGTVLSILDLGIGYGNIGRAIRDRYPHTLLLGVEVWEPYLIRKQDHIYDRIIIGDVNITWRLIGHSDIVLAFDIVEHFEKPLAISLIKQYQYLSSIALLVSVPLIKYEQHSKKGNPYEEHKYQWTINDMESLGGELIYKGEIVGIFLFRNKHGTVDNSILDLLKYKSPLFLGYCIYCSKNIIFSRCPICNTGNEIWWNRSPKILLKKPLGLLRQKNPQPVEEYTTYGIMCTKCGWNDRTIRCSDCDNEIPFSEFVLLTEKVRNKV